MKKTSKGRIIVGLVVSLLFSNIILYFLFFSIRNQISLGAANQVPRQSPESSLTALTSSPETLPTPLQGQGPFACDPYGVCNRYKDTKKMGCPKTFADPLCLGKCSDKANRCTK